MKNTTIVILIVILIFGVGAFVYFNPGENVTSKVSSGSGEVQKITLSMKNYNYYPNTISVKAGVPVSITLDNSVGGCYRSFVIPDLGVRVNSRNPSQTIDFTPTKPGTYRFACSMGMGTGKLVVE